MKRFIACLTVVTLLLSVSGTVYAAPPVNQNEVRLCYNSEFDFTVTEREGDDNTIVRTFERKNRAPATAMSVASVNASSAQTEQAETKAILAALGMEEAFIDRLSEEALEDYANSEQIVSTVSYIKTDAEGNSLNITEEEAQEAAGTYGLTLPPHVLDDPAPGYIPETAVKEDSYMKLVLMVSYFGEARYKFSVNATWLTSPIYRAKDSLGICAQGITIINSTKLATYSYSSGRYIGETIYDPVNHTDDLNDFYGDSSSPWEGLAVVVDLKNDTLGSNYGYRNHMVHIEFEGLVTQPEQALNFNVTASYVHSMVVVLPTFSIGITGTGNSLGIGITSNIIKESRIATFDEPFKYIP